MKYQLAALAAAFVLAGCEQARQVRQLTPEQQEMVKNYLAERRAMFIASMQENVTGMDRKLAELSDAIAMLEDNAVADNNLEAVRELRSRFDLLFDNLTKADAESWDGAKRALEWAWRDLRMAYQLVKDLYDS